MFNDDESLKAGNTIAGIYDRPLTRTDNLLLFLDIKIQTFIPRAKSRGEGNLTGQDHVSNFPGSDVLGALSTLAVLPEAAEVCFIDFLSSPDLFFFEYCDFATLASLGRLFFLRQIFPATDSCSHSFPQKQF